MNFPPLAELANRMPGRFFLPPAEWPPRVRNLQGLVFDWDGVFNNGTKGEGLPSTFNEADSAGVNLLRLAHWLATGSVLPVFIVSGQHNPTALHLARRDHYNGLFFKMKNKADAIRHMAKTHGLEPEHLCVMYDDGIDLPMAELCGLRFQAGRAAAVGFSAYVEANGLADYVTASPHPIREGAEWLALCTHHLPAALEARRRHSEAFRAFTEARDRIPEPEAHTAVSEGGLQ